MTEETFERSLELKATQAGNIAGLVGAWWKEISKQAQSPATPGKLYAIGNYLVELTKNSLSDGKSDGKVTAIFDGEKVKIVIDDLGSGEKEINLNVKGDYGMKESIEYFDVFTVESKGRKYEKNFRNIVEETDDSDLYDGSKLTIVKYHITQINEAAETYHSNRNFEERM
ncbi:MAG: hypothetical protein WCF93_03050 [Candidatus Moraniibacteriota bacterium]